MLFKNIIALSLAGICQFVFSSLPLKALVFKDKEFILDPNEKAIYEGATKEHLFIQHDALDFLSTVESAKYNAQDNILVLFKKQNFVEEEYDTKDVFLLYKKNEKSRVTLLELTFNNSIAKYEDNKIFFKKNYQTYTYSLSDSISCFNLHTPLDALPQIQGGWENLNRKVSLGNKNKFTYPMTETWLWPHQLFKIVYSNNKNFLYCSTGKDYYIAIKSPNVVKKYVNFLIKFDVWFKDEQERSLKMNQNNSLVLNNDKKLMAYYSYLLEYDSLFSPLFLTQSVPCSSAIPEIYKEIKIEIKSDELVRYLNAIWTEKGIKVYRNSNNSKIFFQYENNILSFCRKDVNNNKISILNLNLNDLGIPNAPITPYIFDIREIELIYITNVKWLLKSSVVGNNNTYAEIINKHVPKKRGREDDTLSNERLSVLPSVSNSGLNQVVDNVLQSHQPQSQVDNQYEYLDFFNEDLFQ